MKKIKWEEKVEMVKAFSRRDMDKVEAIVKERGEAFDEQAWDMFLNAIPLNEKEVVQRFQPLVPKGLKFVSWRTCIRYEAFLSGGLSKNDHS